MLKLFTKSILLFLIVLGVLYSIFLQYPQSKPKNTYLLGAKIKHTRLDTVSSPRIILIGGSNLAFGIDTKAIQDSLGINIINMGINGGFGLQYTCSEILHGLRQGDIVVFNFEYLLHDGNADIKHEVQSLYPSARFFEELTLWQKIKNEYDYRVSTTTKNIIKIQKVINKEIPSEDDNNNPEDTNLIFRYSGFNQYGDLESHLTKPSVGPQYDIYQPDGVDYDKYIMLFNDFAKKYESKGAKTYFMFVTYPESVFKQHEKIIEKYDAKLKLKAEFPILNTPQSMVLPDSCFFDSYYHLNKVGRQKRVGLMVKFLKMI